MHRRDFLRTSAASVAALSAGTRLAPALGAPLAPEDANADRAAWFRAARFGMFVHFGLYSIPAGVWDGRIVADRNWYAEWIRYQHDWPQAGGIPREAYDTLLAQFDPAGFDADAWIASAADAGMGYFLITAKHHDGFALWPSRVSRYTVAEATPFRRDVLGELAAACRRHGVRLGFYYSHWQDWEHPGGAKPPWPEIPEDPTVEQTTPEAFEVYWREKALPQVAELLEYQPDLLWFDTWSIAACVHMTPARLEELIALVRRIRPACLVNSRIGTTWCHPDGDRLVDIFSQQDNRFPGERLDRTWETSGTMQRSWGWHRADFTWKPTERLLRNLVDSASRGGNYQLNVGPMGNGRFPAPALRRLREIGAWMGVNGEAVVGTRSVPIAEPAWGRVTARDLDGGGTRIYLHVYDWADAIELPGTLGSVRAARMLETGESVEFVQEAERLRVRLPASCPDARVAVVAVDME